MTDWCLAPRDLWCGGPHAEPVLVRAGQPVLVIVRSRRFSRHLYRCVACAGSPPLGALLTYDRAEPARWSFTPDLFTARLLGEKG